jgi:hypothetical protein
MSVIKLFKEGNLARFPSFHLPSTPKSLCAAGYLHPCKEPAKNCIRAVFALRVWGNLFYRRALGCNYKEKSDSKIYSQDKNYVSNEEDVLKNGILDELGQVITDAVSLFEKYSGKKLKLQNDASGKSKDRLNKTKGNNSDKVY